MFILVVRLYGVNKPKFCRERSRHPVDCFSAGPHVVVVRRLKGEQTYHSISVTNQDLNNNTFSAQKINALPLLFNFSG